MFPTICISYAMVHIMLHRHLSFSHAPYPSLHVPNAFPSPCEMSVNMRLSVNDKR